MKTKKFLMLLAAVLLSCVSAMAQNSPLKGDVNGDGKVDVADIVAILEIMKNGAKEIQSIKWASTTAVNGTTGATPSLGDITLTYNDGTTGTIAYNASGVTLYTDAAGNTPFSNANSGTFNVWAKYCGMTTTNSKQVTLSAPVAGTYYWYVGTTKPTVDSDIETIGIVTSTPIATLNINDNDNYQYFAWPKEWGEPTLIDNANNGEFTISKIASLTSAFDENPNSIYNCRRVSKNTGDITCTITWTK